MDRKLNIGVIGGGSIFTPELIDLLGQYTAQIGAMRVVMMDVNTERQRTVVGLCERIIKRTGRPVEIAYTDSYEEAIKGMDFILVQYRVGFEEGRISDDAIAKKHKIPFVETVSVPGMGAFLRSYYQAEIIAELVQKYAPEAWIMNFANPSGALSEAFYRLGCKMVLGVCNGPTGYREWLAKELGAENPQEVFMNWRGLNHLNFIDGIFYKGENKYPWFANREDKKRKDKPQPDTNFNFTEGLGFFYNSYVRYFYHKESIVDWLQKEEKTRGEAVKEVNAEILELYKDEALDTLPEKLTHRGGFGYAKAVADLMRCLITGEAQVHFPSLRNGTIFPELPEDAFIEVPAIAFANDVRALQMEPLPPAAKVLVYTMKQYERALFDAAKARDKNKLLAAMVMNPLFGSECLSRPVLEDVLEANRAYLPETLYK
ncbi:MAG: 6-phospho-beta-glucosidase [Defluviitaleaceae bacterium]|nr:6-phospho-beta-glucosidase [Defluviitaleaceae bacterium]